MNKLIFAGKVAVDHKTVLKPAYSVVEGAQIEVVHGDRWVSRGALKLIAALDRFNLDPFGRLVLDVGASTGGFSQVLLSRGARKLIAADVGHGQLAAELLTDPALISVEGCNVRELTVERFSVLTGGHELPSLVTADLSFISLRLVLPVFAFCATEIGRAHV